MTDNTKTDAEMALEWINEQIRVAAERGIPHVDAYETIRTALRRADAAHELALALELILKTHDLTCKGEDCQISGIDLGRAALAKYKETEK